jgi:hypothetical protein
MNYIKKYKTFESINDLYQKISVDEYNDMFDLDDSDDSDDQDVFSRSKSVFFKDKEIKEVQNIVPESIRNIFKSDVIFLKYLGVQISINKFDDEWFLVMVTKSPTDEELRSTFYKIDDYTFEYYKCDQIDGLINLLKKLVEGLLPWVPNK